MILTYKDIVLLGFVAMLNVSLTNPAFISSPAPVGNGKGSQNLKFSLFLPHFVGERLGKRLIGLTRTLA
ncbi:hypothetical protein CEN45_03295 [Fischerella thermalis CCMEE 5198]|nr:hypothetical protein CI594_15425 [Fischerella thermalis CCMEE 5196]PMB26604.1 hypothetical protein CEN45_03295 [Fischerella thermalis CCMEE 5198]